MVSPLFEAEAMFHLQQPHMQHLRSKFTFVFSRAVLYFQCASTCTFVEKLVCKLMNCELPAEQRIHIVYII